MKKLIIIASLCLTVCGGAFAAARPAAALTLLDDALIQEASCVDENNTTIKDCKPSINTFVKVGLNLTRIILGVVGALTLAMFVYGGFTLLISGGSSEAVSRGKQIITGAVVGLIIVFVSYTVINFVINTILQAKIDGKPAFTGSSPSGTTNGQNQTQGELGTCGTSNTLETCITMNEQCDGGTGQIIQKQCGANKQCCLKRPTCTSENGVCMNSAQACQDLTGAVVSASGCDPGVCCVDAEIESE